MDCPAFFEAVDGRLPGRYEGPTRTVVGATDGEMVTILHYALRTGPVTHGDLEATLDAVAESLAV